MALKTFTQSLLLAVEKGEGLVYCIIHAKGIEYRERGVATGHSEQRRE